MAKITPERLEAAGYEDINDAFHKKFTSIDEIVVSVEDAKVYLHERGSMKNYELLYITTMRQLKQLYRALSGERKAGKAGNKKVTKAAKRLCAASHKLVDSELDSDGYPPAKYACLIVATAHLEATIANADSNPAATCDRAHQQDQKD